MMTLTSLGGVIVLKWMAKPWLKSRVLPFFRFGRDVGLVDWRG
jgi:hypothetical protein